MLPSLPPFDVLLAGLRLLPLFYASPFSPFHYFDCHAFDFFFFATHRCFRSFYAFMLHLRAIYADYATRASSRCCDD